MSKLFLSFACFLMIRMAAAEPLEDLQWAIKNSGQPVKYEVSDLVTKELPTLPGEDIRVYEIPPEVPSLKKVRVAVLDTGIDFNHPNLKGQIVRDEAECSALEKYKDCLKKSTQQECDQLWAKVDANGNGYPLDCSGWNFTAGKNDLTGIYGNNNADDDTGHGTHVSGIIAAAQNGTGVRGVLQNVEILPIKVIKTSPNSPIKPQEVGELPPTNETELHWTTGLSDILARGMRYAIASGADIINMSLGWTPGADSEAMRQMVALAQSKGILIVAAAGNDSSDARVMPCQYEGVICVASHNPDGTLSHYSNYGSFVDLAAPGMRILSAWPLNKRAMNFTSKPGFEIKNGTSMATPYVAGALARLISAGYSPKEAYARLVLGSRPKKYIENKYLRFGNLDLGRSFRISPQPLILPEKKTSILMSWDRKKLELPLTYNLKNYWISGKNLRIKAHLIHPEGMQWGHLNQQDWSISEWGTDEIRSFSSLLIIDDIRIDGRLLIEVQVESEGNETQTFRIPVELAVMVNADFSSPGVQTFPILDKPINKNSILRSVTNKNGGSSQDYIAIEENGSRQKLQLLEQQSQSYQITAEAEIDRVEGELMMIHKLDPDQAQKPVYVLIYRTPPKNRNARPGFNFQFYDSKLKFLKSLEYDYKIATISERFQWLKVRKANEVLWAPAWIGMGTAPDADLPVDPAWDPYPRNPMQIHFYYLDQDRVHTLNAPEGYSFVQTLTQSSEEMIQGIVPLVLSQGEDRKRSYFSAILNGTDILSIQPLLQEKSRMLEGLDAVLEITPLDSKAHIFGTSFSGTSAHRMHRTTAYFSNSDQTDGFKSIDAKHQPSSPYDAVTRVIGTYVGHERRAVFFQTQYRLKFQDLVTGETALGDLDRFSFLPSYVFNKSFFPVAVGNQKSKDYLPGILVPESMGISFATEVIIPLYHSNNNNLVSLGRPAWLRLAAGEDCMAMGNFIKAGEEVATQSVFFCGDRFHRIPLEFSFQN